MYEGRTIVINSRFEVAVLAATLVHFRCDRSKKFRSETARVMYGHSFPIPRFEIDSNNRRLRVCAGSLRVRCSERGFSPDNLVVHMTNKGTDRHI